MQHLQCILPSFAVYVTKSVFTNFFHLLLKKLSENSQERMKHFAYLYYYNSCIDETNSCWIFLPVWPFDVAETV